MLASRGRPAAFVLAARLAMLPILAPLPRRSTATLEYDTYRMLISPHDRNITAIARRTTRVARSGAADPAPLRSCDRRQRPLPRRTAYRRRPRPQSAPVV